MTFANGEAYTDEPDRELGRVLHRQPRVAAGQSPGLRGAAGRRAGPQQGRPAAAADGGRRHARRRRHGDRAGRRRGGPWRPGGGRGGGNLPPVEAKLYVNPRGGVEEDYPLDVHTRNFLDCIKSRQKPNARVRDRLLRGAAVPARARVARRRASRSAGTPRRGRARRSSVAPATQSGPCRAVALHGSPVSALDWS